MSLKKFLKSFSATMETFLIGTQSGRNFFLFYSLLGPTIFKIELFELVNYLNKVECLFNLPWYNI